MNLDRRRFLAGTGLFLASALTSSCGRSPSSSGEIRAERGPWFIEHPSKPGHEELETAANVLGKTWITPNSEFFVLTRKKLKLSDELRRSWTLRIGGEVEQPLEITLHDLETAKDTRMIRFAAYLQCAGYGRRYFKPAAGSPPWGRGAIGNALWTGIPLTDLLERAVVKPSARYVHLLEQGASLDQMDSYVKSIPIDKARDLRTIVALRMNDEPLPSEHGGPVRALVPGWGGTYSVKMLSQVLVGKEACKGEWMEQAYRVPSQPVPPGTRVRPEAMQALTAFSVNSLITAPPDGQRVARGPVEIRGLAWTGEAKVTAVEVSIDDGSTWNVAQLGPETAQVQISSDQGQTWSPIDTKVDELRYIWRNWSYQWDAKPGDHWLRVRAHDSEGKVQPLEQDNWNPGGYDWHGAEARLVTVV